VITARLTLIALAVFASRPALTAAHDSATQDRPLREFTVTAADCTYTPARLDVWLGDRVRIVLVAEDAPHSFVIAAYRLSKRAVPGRTASLEFLADQAGTFPYFSDLSSDQDCADLRGELVVNERGREAWPPLAVSIQTDIFSVQR
jgi:heme/copper-type cytochrome/quinol oxidase subunit 2